MRWFVLTVCLWALASGLLPAAQSAEPMDYSDYAVILKKHVDKNGLVDYRALKANPERLEAFLSAMATLDRSRYNAWNDKQKIAFWINAYNALTLKAIIDHYPIQASFVGALRFPKNSIRQIDGVWDKIRFRVIGTRMTLNEIEHKTLREDFNEPRIHMALVCASMGCPILRNEPYAGARLDAQLEDQTKRFLSKKDKFRIARAEGEVYLSPIFKWFGEDFVKTYGTNETFRGHDRELRAVLNFVSRHLDEQARAYLETGRYDVSFLDYDWSLNEQ
jgi:hypothetical protein